MLEASASFDPELVTDRPQAEVAATSNQAAASTPRCRKRKVLGGGREIRR
jgi:hypothetical protein